MTAPARAPNAVARQNDRTNAVDVPREKRDELRAELSRYAPRFAQVLPKHLTPDRMVTLTLVAAIKTPLLFDCTMESIALSVMKISQWGLEIGETAHLVPFRDRKSGTFVCTPIADWKGLIQMAINSRHVRDVQPHAVYEKERFVVRFGLEPVLEHDPIFGTDAERGTLTHAYAVAWLRDNRPTFEVMSKSEIDRIRNNAPSKDSPAWNGHYAEMAKKTVIRRLLKRLPKSATLSEALDAYEAVETGERPALSVPGSPAARGDEVFPERKMPVALHSGYGQEAVSTEDENGKPIPRENVVERSGADSGTSDERVATSATADAPRAPAESTAASEPAALGDDAEIDVVTHHALSACGPVSGKSPPVICVGGS
jgi:recombination protein RecT